MSNAPPEPVEVSTHKVELTCAMGTIIWSPNREVYGRMPRATRDEFLDLTGRLKITPELNTVADRILRQAGAQGVTTDSLDTNWCLEETREDSCSCYGSIVWMIGQGIHDVIPDDQREPLQNLVLEFLHDYLKSSILPVLVSYVQRTFQQ